MANTAEVINFPIKTEQTGGPMADLSNGYTRIANEIQKLKPRLRMSGREWQCLEAVIWLTYGWNKKQDRVTNTVIAGLTGLADTHVYHFPGSVLTDYRILKNYIKTIGGAV